METKTIKEVKIGKSGEGKKGHWTQYQIVFTDGSKASTFDNKIATMGGKIINVELEQNGQYTNIIEWKLAGNDVAENPKAAIAPESQEVTLNLKDNKSKAVNLSYAKDLVVAKVIELEVIGLVATQFERYCNGEINGVELGKMLKGIKLPEAPKTASSAKSKPSNKDVEPLPDESDSIPF